MSDALFAVPLAALLALAAVTVLRLPERWGTARGARAGRIGVVLLAVLPVAAVLLDAEFRVFSFHGFLHASIVQRLAVSGLELRNPLVAGEPLPYPWLHHAGLALLARGLELAPPWSFALTQLALLGATAWALLALARRLGLDERSARASSILALWGVAAFARGPLAAGIQALGGPAPERRLAPFEKFTNPNSNSLGLLFLTLGLWALVAARARPGHGATWGPAAGLAAATLGAALLYPMAWVPLAGTAGLVAAFLLVRPTARDLPRAAALAGATALGSLLALPYLLGLQAGKAPGATLAPDPSPAHLVRGTVQLLLVAVPAAALALAGGVRGRAPLRAAPERFAVLGAAVLVGALLFLGVRASLGSEYKFLLAAALAAGVALGPALAALEARRPLAGGLALALLMLPGADFLVNAVRMPLHVGRTAGVEGRWIVSGAPEEHALHRWIRDHTPPEAVFVDSTLDVPVFAGRALYVAQLLRGNRERWLRSLAGWGMRPSVVQESVFGHPEAVLKPRRAAVREILGPGPVSACTLAGVRETVGAAPVYVVARGPASGARLAADARFEELFASGAATVFALGRWSAAERDCPPGG